MELAIDSLPIVTSHLLLCFSPLLSPPIPHASHIRSIQPLHIHTSYRPLHTASSACIPTYTRERDIQRHYRTPPPPARRHLLRIHIALPPWTPTTTDHHPRRLLLLPQKFLQKLDGIHRLHPVVPVHPRRLLARDAVLRQPPACVWVRVYMWVWVYESVGVGVGGMCGSKGDVRGGGLRVWRGVLWRKLRPTVPSVVRKVGGQREGNTHRQAVKDKAPHPIPQHDIHPRTTTAPAAAPPPPAAAPAQRAATPMSLKAAPP